MATALSLPMNICEPGNCRMMKPRMRLMGTVRSPPTSAARVDRVAAVMVADRVLAGQVEVAVTAALEEADRAEVVVRATLTTTITAMAISPPKPTTGRNATELLGAHLEVVAATLEADLVVVVVTAVGPAARPVAAVETVAAVGVTVAIQAAPPILSGPDRARMINQS